MTEIDLILRDVRAINRQALGLIRDLERRGEGERLSGIASVVRRRIAALADEEIERAAGVPVCLFRLSLTEKLIEEHKVTPAEASGE
ncbi:MAG: hypothetical protein QMD73_13255 [Rhodocyclaceae bacterium]|nr:hypothetical protein [Rhodocyclaceae bacterium]